MQDADTNASQCMNLPSFGIGWYVKVYNLQNSYDIDHDGYGDVEKAESNYY